MWWTNKRSNNEEDLANIEKKTESLFDILFTAPAALLNINQHFVLSNLEEQVRLFRLKYYDEWLHFYPVIIYNVERFGGIILKRSGKSISVNSF